MKFPTGAYSIDSLGERKPAANRIHLTAKLVELVAVARAARGIWLPFTCWTLTGWPELIEWEDGVQKQSKRAVPARGFLRSAQVYL